MNDNRPVIKRTYQISAENAARLDKITGKLKRYEVSPLINVILSHALNLIEAGQHPGITSHETLILLDGDD